MQLKKILIISSFVFLAGCMAPKKPNVMLCHIDYEHDECICGMTEGDTELKVYPLEFCDKATAFRPKDWEEVKNYIDELVIFIEKGCR